MENLRKLQRFFPVQLLILHLKNHQILVFVWAFLFLIITNNWGRSYGIPYLLLDPEYLGEVSFLGFGILGAAFGGFLMTWNIAVYILDSYRFPFLATFNRPFAIFCINNSLLPIVFLTTYFIIVINFQLKQELASTASVLLDVSGFFTGLFVVIVFSAVYFTTTTKNIFAMFGMNLKAGTRITRRMRMRQNMMWDHFRRKEEEFPVDEFLTARLKIRRIRGVEHYDEKMILSVLRQNHFSALIIELATLATLIGLGFLIDYEIFNIPAGASMLLMFGILVSLSGVLSFWLKAWKNTALILLIVALDIFYRFGGFNYNNKAYGLDYSKEAAYTVANLEKIGSAENMEEDKRNTIAILEKWKKQTGQEKPKMILINVSGGGLSSAKFTTLIMQKADSLLHGDLFKHTVAITGSSGGMFGAAYMRELYLHKQLGQEENLNDPIHAENISKDLLNSICFTIVVNDLFFPWQKFEEGGYTYRKDRGYAMEKQLNMNTGSVMKKTIGANAQYEKDAVIPLMIFVPTIINDERRLIVSTQPLSYLMRPPLQPGDDTTTADIDGVDFMRMFSENNPLNLELTSAIRMNGTYPYILPNVTLPSTPVIKVMDAGFRDNYGVETTTRFIYTFRDWIKDNTSGVVLLEIRNFKRENDIEAYHRESVIDRLINPVSNLYENWDNIQDYNHSYLVEYAKDWLDGKMDVIYFEYIPLKEKEASMSLHLTTREKRNIAETLYYRHIKQNMEKLKTAME